MKRHNLKSCETNWIPSIDGRESVSVTTQIRARCDVVETHEATAVQPGIEEAERGLAF